VTSPVVLVVDGNSLVHRSYHAQARTGLPTWAVRGLLTQLVAAVDRVRPDVVVVGFDDPDSSVRRDRWPTYKSQRGDKLETLVEQLQAAAAALRELGVAVVVPPGLEADDVLASTAEYVRSLGGRTVVMTSDRDAFCLIDDCTSVLRIINGGVDASPIMTAPRLVTLLGVRPDQYRDYAALRGDASDNLPGVRGIGKHRAAQLLAAFGSARAAFDDPAAVRERLGAVLATLLADPDARPRWEFNCAVMTQHTDIALDLDPNSGPGRLPLSAARVAAVFGALQLTWTTPQALCVLADADPGATPSPPVVETAAPLPWFTGWSSGGAPRKLPKLSPRKPAMAQLSLFD
jgi:DNA polymerase-1